MHKHQMLQIPNISTKVHKFCSEQTNFVLSRQILFVVDKKISTTQNAHCLLPSTTTTTTATTIISQQYFYWDPGPIIVSVCLSVCLSVCPNLVYAQQQQWSGTSTKNNFLFYFLFFAKNESVHIQQQWSTTTKIHKYQMYKYQIF